MRSPQNVSAIISWGSLWGISEASVGHLLHISGLPFGWLFWFPLAFYFMHSVYRQTNLPGTACATAVIAASLKLLDLLAPMRIDYVVNPAVAILLEGVAVAAVFRLMQQRSREHNFRVTDTMLLSTAWRTLYLLYAWLVMPPAWRAISAVVSGRAFLSFALMENAINIVTIQVFLRWPVARMWPRLWPPPVWSFMMRPATAGLLLATAVLLQWRL